MNPSCSFVALLPLATLPTNPIPSVRHPRESVKLNYSAEWINLLSPTAGIASPGRIEPPRSGSVSFATGDDELFTFGGYAEIESAAGTPPDRFVVNDLWKFVPYQESSSAWGWTKIDQNNGFIPGPRLATAMAVLPSQKSAVLLGGWDPQEPGTGGVILDDVSLLDVGTLKWTQPATEEDDGEAVRVPGGPTSRHIAVSVCIDNNLDGKGNAEAILLHNHRCVEHVLLLSLSGGGRSGQWKHQQTTGDVPSSRGLHCAAQLNNSKSDRSNSIVIFGGAAKDGSMSNEAFVLDLNTWKWTKLVCSGNQPSPRAGACLCPLNENTVILFGGAEFKDGGLVGLNDVWSLTVNSEKGTGTWKRLIENQSADGNNVDGTFPFGRNAATLTRMNAHSSLPNDVLKKYPSGDEDDVHFLLQGGWYPFRKTFNDVFVLRVKRD